MKNLEIKTDDSVKTSDKLYTYKRWFNGIKHFFTVKVNPPYHTRSDIYPDIMPTSLQEIFDKAKDNK